MPPRSTPPDTPAFTMTHEEVVVTILRRVLDGKRHQLRPVDKWSSHPSDLVSEEMRIRPEDAQPIVDAGLLVLDTNVGPNTYKLTAEGIRLASRVIGRQPLDVEKLIRATLDTVLFGPSDAIEGRTAIPAIYVPSPEPSKLVLVLGENAGGKSLFRRVIRQMTHRGQKGGFGDPEIKPGPFPVREMIALSMQGRTSSGFERGVIYGEESYHSTGENSAHTVTMGIKTVRERDHTTILYWDEPDVGMSGGAAAGAGVAIRDFVTRDEAPLMEAVFITSHTPALVRQLASLRPHYLYLGSEDGPATLDAWLVWQNDPPPISPEALKAMSHKRYLDVMRVLDSREKSKRDR